MKNNNYQIIIKTKINSTLIAQWHELWEKAENANVFNSYEWFLAYKETYKIRQYEIYACYKEKKLVAILPLFLTKCYGIKVMSSVNNYISGTPFLTETYNSELIKYFFNEIISKRNVLITRIDAKASNMLKEQFPALFFSLVSVTPYLKIDNDPLRFIPKSKLRQIKKILKKNADEIRFEMYDDQHDLKKYLDLIFNIEQNSSKKRRAMDLFSKTANRKLYKNIIKYCGKFINIYFLYYKNKPIVYSFSFIYKKIHLGFQTSYLFDYKKLSPGKSIIVNLLEDTHKRSIAIFDFSGGISSYKQEFTPHFYFRYNLYFSSNIFIMYWWKFINMGRRLNQILFPIKNTRDHEFLFKKLEVTVDKKLAENRDDSVTDNPYASPSLNI